MLKWLTENPQLLFAALFLLGPVIASLLKAKQRPVTRTPRPVAGDESDLERRVRENFEEILRKRRKKSRNPETEAEPTMVFETDPEPSQVSRPEPVPVPEPLFEPAPPPPPPPPPARSTPTLLHAPVSRRVQRPDLTTADSPYQVNTNAYQTDTDAYQIETAAAYQVDLDAYSLERHRRPKTAGELVQKSSLNRESLRRAVLWKEILDAPLALRERRELDF